MKNRQGSVWMAITWLLILVIGSGCQADAIVEPVTTPVLSPTSISLSPPSVTPPPSPVPVVTALPTERSPQTCTETEGIVSRETIHSTVMPGRMVFSLYLPPCYDALKTYPVLYLFHGLTYTDDQWIRLGAVQLADQKIGKGELAPFLMVFPYYPNPEGPSDSHFPQAVIETLVPWVDENYAHCSQPACRWIGGLSRGGGWAFEIFMKGSGIFGKLGGHSPSLFSHDLDRLSQKMLAAWHDEPVWIDVGTDDKEFRFLQALTDRFVQDGIEMHFSQFAGNHEEAYWQTHLEEYLDWYAGSGSD